MTPYLRVKKIPRLFLAITFTMLFFASSGQTEDLSPGFLNPSGTLFVEIGSFIIWACMLMFFIRQSIRAKAMTFGLLLLISTTAFSWQDTYVNWGMCLLHNPKFNLMPWGATLWTSPYKPWWVIPSYAFFWAIMFLLVLEMITKLRTRFPKLGRTSAVLIVAVPFFYLWDLVFEAGAVSAGWYSYVKCFGPAIVMSKGNFPLLYPILFIVLWAAGAVWFLSLRGPNGNAVFESWFGIELIRSPFFRGIAKIGVWILVMNLFHLVFAVIPLIGIRELFGVHSTLIP